MSHLISEREGDVTVDYLDVIEQWSLTDQCRSQSVERSQ